MWIYNKLFTPTNILQSINDYKQSNNRFLMMPLGIELSHGAHANILIYDRQNNTLTRFEPNGMDPPYGFNYRHLTLDREIETYFADIFRGVKYVRPKDYLPKIGFQSLEEYDTTKRIGDPGGFCAAWCIWFAHQVLQYPDIPFDKLVKKLIIDIKSKNIKFRNLIRSFAEQITEIRTKILGQTDINDWINNTVTDKIISSIELEIQSRI
jgi:hypothetical protein